ncbi:MAG: RNA 2',3'-cyclic phosphodiesterase [Pseudomonadota bacterium]
MIRSFIGLPVPTDATRALMHRQSPIAGARIVPEENLHLTLAFLGDQSQALLRRLADDIAACADGPVTVTLNAPNLLGKSPNAIALDAVKDDRLMALEARLTRMLHDADVEFVGRRFRPHITLYRLPNRVEPGTALAIQRWLDAQAGAEPISFQAQEMRLYQSTLTKDGPVYTSLAEFPLTNA